MSKPGKDHVKFIGDDQMETLFDALESWGNQEGTEHQLNLTAELLRLAIGLMSPAARQLFFKQHDVQELLL